MLISLMRRCGLVDYCGFQYLLNLGHDDLINHVAQGETDIVKLATDSDDVCIKYNDELIIKIYPAYHLGERNIVLIADHHLVIKHPSEYSEFTFDDDLVTRCRDYYYHYYPRSTTLINIPIVCRTRINLTNCYICGHNAMFPIDDDQRGGVCCHTKYRLCARCHASNKKRINCYFCETPLLKPRKPINYILSHTGMIKETAPPLLKTPEILIESDIFKNYDTTDTTLLDLQQRMEMRF
jgi:hypothetical protein